MNQFQDANQKRDITKALINGRVVVYDAASSRRKVEAYKSWSYLGQGVIYQIGGVLQNSARQFDFWGRPS